MADEKEIVKKDGGQIVNITEDIKAVMNEEGLSIIDIDKHMDLAPIRAMISKEMGKIIIGGETVDSITGRILKFWHLNKLIEDGKIKCMGINGKPVVETPVSKECATCPNNQFRNGHILCRNNIIVLLKAKDSSLPIKIAIPPTNIRDFQQMLQIPIARVKPLINYDVTFSPKEKTSKDGLTYYVYDLKLRVNDNVESYIPSYVKYADEYYNIISNKVYGAIPDPLADKEDTESDSEIKDDDLPF